MIGPVSGELCAPLTNIFLEHRAPRGAPEIYLEKVRVRKIVAVEQDGFLRRSPTLWATEPLLWNTFLS
jgi:hypothetical protein